MRYAMSLIEARLRFNRTTPCWSRDEWRFDTTEHAMVFGAPQGRFRPGSACVFGRHDGSWGRPQRLEASDGHPGDGFGFRVAIEGNALVVTAPFAAGKRGAAYVYRRDGFLWIEEQKLVAPDGAEGAFFGGSVDIGNEMVVVGAERADGRGAVYVYRRGPSSWGSEQKLRNRDGMRGDEFGYSLSMQDGEIIVGAPSARKGGAACAYTRKDGRWTQAQELVVSQDVKGPEFGRHVGHLLDERTLIIGDSGMDDWGRPRVVAHSFQRAAGSWCPIGTMKLGR